MLILQKYRLKRVKFTFLQACLNCLLSRNESDFNDFSTISFW